MLTPFFIMYLALRPTEYLDVDLFGGVKIKRKKNLNLRFYQVTH